MKYQWRLIGVLFAGIISIQAQEAKPIYYFNPGWSPDGKKIVFESTRDGKFAIYTIEPDGSNLRKLTNGEANDEQARWSKDGRQIVFISDRDGHSQLYLMNADGYGQHRLTNGSEQDYVPDFSPKGDQVVFVSNDIYVIRTDGTGRTRLPQSGLPRWSPNGILFTKTEPIPKDAQEKMAKMSREERQKVIAKRNSTEEIYLMDKDGKDVRNLTNNQVRDYEAEWSKTAKTIYFLSERDGATQVYAMNADGSQVRKVADGSIVSGTNISPDEKYFVYAKKVESKYGLYLYDIKSGKERLLIGG